MRAHILEFRGDPARLDIIYGDHLVATPADGGTRVQTVGESPDRYWILHDPAFYGFAPARPDCRCDACHSVRTRSA